MRSGGREPTGREVVRAERGRSGFPGLVGFDTGPAGIPAGPP
jgi:hypothetical protein